MLSCLHDITYNQMCGLAKRADLCHKWDYIRASVSRKVDTTRSKADRGVSLFARVAHVKKATSMDSWLWKQWYEITSHHPTPQHLQTE